jgi:hypothetical protein
MIDWSTEFRSGRTVYMVRHAVRVNGVVQIIKTWHFDVRPANRAEAEALGQARVDELNARAQQEASKPRLDENHFDTIRSQLRQLIDLGVSPTQITNRLNTLITNVKADNGIT